MKIEVLSLKELFKIASSKSGLRFDIGPFTVRLRSNNKPFVQTFRDLYLNFPVSPSESIVDFHINMLSRANHRRWIKPQIDFSIDGHKPFSPFAVTHAMPLFEWGMNWCIARHSQQYLMLHAAVLEKNGKCLVLPALPGSGKSTLAGALSQKDWRFLSDEFCLIRPVDGKVIPIPRPTPLKNQSIQVIRDFSPDAFIGPLFHNTRKGTIGHLRAPETSINQQQNPGTPKLIVFPKYQAQSKLVLSPLKKSFSILKLASNAFNYQVQGENGFRLVSNMIKNCGCYSLTYSSLDESISRLNQLIKDA